MAETPTLKLPYPGTGDPPHGPNQIKALAEAVEAVLGRGIKVYTPKIIATEQGTSSTSFTTLTTADEIKEITIGEGGIIRIGVRALVKVANEVGGEAALFIGANQLKSFSTGTAPVVQAASIGGTNFRPLGTAPFGLVRGAASESAWGGDVTTGQALALSEASGGEVEVFNLPAGTYTVSVKYRVLSGAGTVTAKSRGLWVAALG